MLAISRVACVFLLIGVQVNYAQSQPISPTTSDVDTEYYFSNTSNEFENGYILCAADKPNCQIQCHADYTCKALTVNASLTQNLLLECDGNDACEYITVYGPNVSANVQCIAAYSCQYGLLQFDDTTSVNMNCDGWFGSRKQAYTCSNTVLNATRAEDLNIQCGARQACRWMTVNGTFVSNSINVECNDYNSCEDFTVDGLYANAVNVFCNDSDIYSCYTLIVYCPSERENQCNFDCSTETSKSCSWIDIYNSDNYTVGFLNVTMDSCSKTPPFSQGSTGSCADFESHCMSSGLSSAYFYTPTIDESYCESYECCPLTHYKVNAECVDGADCVVNCTSIGDPFGIECIRADIDGRNANSLTVLCGTREACMYATITCPVGNCTVMCDGFGACEYLDINASLSTNTNIECHSGCQFMKVYATDNVNVNILCDDGANCGGSYFVTNTETVNVICNGQSSCYGGGTATIYAENTVNTNILCNGSRACSFMVIRAMGSDHMNVNCEATTFASCNSLKLYCPETENSCHLNCADTTNISNYGSCENAEVHFLNKALVNNNAYSPILNLSCPTNGNDCVGMQFDCKNYNSDTNQFSYNEYLWSPTAQQYHCAFSNNYFCCAGYNEIYCEPDQDCNVVCDDTQICSTALINAKYATSLTVSCVNGSCYDTYFECPLRNASSCFLDCGASELGGYPYDDTGCYRTHVRGNGATQIDIQCGSDCRDMVVDITSDDSTTNLNCSYPSSCYQMEFFNYGSNSVSNFYCDGDQSCYYIRMHINASKSVALSCSGVDSCRGSRPYGIQSGNVTIDCNTQESCSNPIWYLSEAHRVTINANANYSFSQSSVSVSTPYHSPNSTVINCGTDQECYGLVLRGPVAMNISWLHISCNDPVNGCANVSVRCYPSGSEVTTTLLSPNGEYYCDPQSPECCPFGEIITVSPTTKDPTASPTTADPTTSPTTADPTVSPTTADPTASPTTADPSASPTTADPTATPTTATPTAPTTAEPTASPTTANPTASPTTADPTASPTTADPTTSPTTADPTVSPQTETTEIVDETSPSVTATDKPPITDSASHLFPSLFVLFFSILSGIILFI